jgi:large subunit ribosomal protein L20
VAVHIRELINTRSRDFAAPPTCETMTRGGPAKRYVKRAKVFALTKGFRGKARNCYSIAVRAAQKALQHAYRGRKLKKREMRKLWIQRINFGSREHDVSYSSFMYGLIKCNIQLNRKVLSELAIHEPRTFQALTDIAKQKHNRSLTEAFNIQPSSADKQHQSLLYQSRFILDSNGRIVKETDV